MSDRVAFARLDHEALQRASADSEHEVAELRRELGVVMDERDTALAGWDKAAAAWADVIQREQLGDNAHFYDMEVLTAERDALTAVVDKALARLEAVRTIALEKVAVSVDAHGIRHGYPMISAERVLNLLGVKCERDGCALLFAHGGPHAAGLAAPVGETPDEPQR